MHDVQPASISICLIDPPTSLSDQHHIYGFVSCLLLFNNSIVQNTHNGHSPKRDSDFKSNN